MTRTRALVLAPLLVLAAKVAGTVAATLWYEHVYLPRINAEWD